MDVNEIIKQADELVNTDKIAAFELYKKAFGLNPENSKVLHALGVLLFNDNQHELGQKYLNDAILKLCQNEILSPDLAQTLAKYLLDLAQTFSIQANQNATAFNLTKSMIFAHIATNHALPQELKQNDFLLNYTKNNELLNAFLESSVDFYENKADIFSALACAFLAYFMGGGGSKESATYKSSLIWLSYLFLEFGDKLISDEFLSKASSIQAAAHNDFFIAQEKRLISARFLQNKDYENAIKALKTAPQNYKNYISLANIFLQMKDFSKVDESVKKAENLATSESQKAHILAFKAFVLLNQNDLKSAENLAKIALSLSAKHRLALLVLNQIYAVKKDYKSLVEISYKILQNHPFNEGVFSTLSGVLYENGDYNESIKIAKIALEYYPNSYKILANLATSLHENKKIEEAIIAYEKALSINPNIPQILNNLSAIAIAQNDWQKAFEYTQKALELDSQNLTILANKARIMIKLQISPDEVRQVGKTIEQIAPNSAFSSEVYGEVALALGDFYGAIEHFSKAIELSPDSPRYYSKIASAYKDINDPINTQKYYKKALELRSDDADTLSNLLYTSHFFADISPKELFAMALKYGKIVESKTEFVFDNWLAQNEPKRLKIGFTSGDFRSHPVGYFLEGVIPLIDKSKLELIAFNTNNQSDELTARIKPFFDDWIDIYAKSPAAQAKIIHEQGINILVDLSGHIAYNALRAFAYKPAPLQCSWIGYWASTGLSAMDYVVGDPIVSPPSEKEVLIEDIWNLPECFFHFTMPPDIDTNELLKISPQPPCAKNGYFTFGSFNNLSKMNESVVALWAKIMLAVPNSKLFLKYKQLTQDSQKDRVKSWFGKYGISADRLILEGHSPRYELLNAYNRVDLALDPFPFHGTTTTAESVMMGVPALSLAGYSYITRIGESTLINSGLSEFIASDENEYFAKAVDIALNGHERLEFLRQNMRELIKDKAVFNTQKFAGDVENMFISMWQKYKKDRL